MFTNGDLDPWHLLSINEDFPDGSVLAATYEAGLLVALLLLQLLTLIFCRTLWNDDCTDTN